MAKYFVILALCASFTCGQNGADRPLTNETVIKMVASGVPAETVIMTIRAASSVSFGFLPGDLDLLQRYHVPDDVVKAMSAKSSGRPIPQPSAPSVQVATPQPSPRTEPPSRPAALPDSQTNDSLIRLVKAGMGEDAIIGIVNGQPGQYSLSTDSLIALKQAGVSDKIIAAMVNRNAGGARDQQSAGEATPGMQPPPPATPPADPNECSPAERRKFFPFAKVQHDKQNVKVEIVAPSEDRSIKTIGTRLIGAIAGARTTEVVFMVNALINGDHARLKCYENHHGCTALGPGVYDAEMDEKNGDIWISILIPVSHKVTRDHWRVAGTW